MEAPKLYTVAEAAHRLRVRPKTVRRRILDRRIMATKPAGAKSWLIPESELKRTINEGVRAR